MRYSPFKAKVLSLSLFIHLVISTDIQRRQEDSPSSSLSIPTFTYGYYSQVYPNGAVTSTANPALATSGTQPSTRPGPDGQDGDSQSPNASEEEIWSEKEWFIFDMCSPDKNGTERPDINFPCNRLLRDEWECFYGQGSQEPLQNKNNDTTPTLRSDKDQLECFCAQDGPGQQYWQNSILYVLRHPRTDRSLYGVKSTVAHKSVNLTVALNVNAFTEPVRMIPEIIYRSVPSEIFHRNTAPNLCLMPRTWMRLTP